MTYTHKVYIRDLLYTCDSLEPDAIRILAHIAKRLVHGQKKYGPINLATDPRSFAQEALEEALDLSVYASIGMLRITDSEKAEETPCAQSSEPDEQSKSVASTD